MIPGGVRRAPWRRGDSPGTSMEEPRAKPEAFPPSSSRVCSPRHAVKQPEVRKPASRAAPRRSNTLVKEEAGASERAASQGAPGLLAKCTCEMQPTTSPVSRAKRGLSLVENTTQTSSPAVAAFSFDKVFPSLQSDVRPSSEQARAGSDICEPNLIFYHILYVFLLSLFHAN